MLLLPLYINPFGAIVAKGLQTFAQVVRDPSRKVNRREEPFDLNHFFVEEHDQMGEQTIENLTIGWIGTGRMGYAMAEHLRKKAPRLLARLQNFPTGMWYSLW